MSHRSTRRGPTRRKTNGSLHLTLTRQISSTIHEAYPGHYVQFLHLNASSATKIEKIFGSYAFVEGWAHYCEQMMLDEGFGAEKKDKTKPTDEEIKRAAKYRMAQADEAMLRLCRLCVSIKLHTQKMSVDEATKFFQDNCYYEAKPARAEAMRGTFDPGYLNYTLGKLQILKLRDDYQAQEGDGFRCTNSTTKSSITACRRFVCCARFC